MRTVARAAFLAVSLVLATYEGSVATGNAGAPAKPLDPTIFKYDGRVEGHRPDRGRSAR